MPRTRVRCPAKINLGLQISDRHADGYHDLRTVFQTIALFDILDLEVRGAKVSAVEMLCDVPELAGPSNLAARAAESVLAATGARRRVRLSLRKMIPAGAGLGGGSSDAAAVIGALPALLGRPLPLERQLEIAAAHGADVPFFLLGGCAVGLGRGAELYPLPEEPVRALVVVHPGLHISTREAYRLLDESRKTRPDRASAPLTSAASGNMMFSFCGLVYGRGWGRLGNDFEPVVFSTYPELARLKGVLTRAGASPALLCGSGSAMFGMFNSSAEARGAAMRVRARWPQWRVWVTRTLSRRQWAREWAKNGL